MNRCRISLPFFIDLKNGLKGKRTNRKTRLFLEKWKPELRDNRLFYQGREVIPYERIEKILKMEAEQNGMPLSRDGAFHYLKTKYVGFKKRTINDWLKRIEQLQLIHKRPHKNTRTNRVNREGIANYRMSASREGRYNLVLICSRYPNQSGATIATSLSLCCSVMDIRGPYQ